MAGVCAAPLALWRGHGAPPGPHRPLRTPQGARRAPLADLPPRQPPRLCGPREERSRGSAVSVAPAPAQICAERGQRTPLCGS